jgi:hypothetical protein
VRVEALASGHRADFERERERADALMAELLKMTADAMAPRKRRLGSKVARSGCVRNFQTSIPTAMPGAQRCSALSLLSTGVMSECLPWWKRLAGWAPNHPKTASTTS